MYDNIKKIKYLIYLQKYIFILHVNNSYNLLSKD